MGENRRYPSRPFLGVGGLIFQDDEVLLVQRGKPPLEDLWSLPGGIVEAGERLEDAIVREVFEETGLNVSADSIATVFERIMPDPAQPLVCEYHYVLIDFFCTILGGTLCPASDAKQLAWLPLHALDGVNLTAGTLNVIRSSHGQTAACPFVTRP